MRKTVLIAIGGHSLIRDDEEGVVTQQHEHAAATSRTIVRLVELGWTVLVTHGNGPQVGAALLRSERAAGEAYPHSLDVCVATTQGEIGYLLQQSLCEALEARQVPCPVVTVVTQVVVSAADLAFQHPTKPIGPFYDRAEAEARRRRAGWTLVEDPVHGFRRVVASPEPEEVVEQDVIRVLLEAGVLVIALGGGGIPVVRDGNRLVGVQAVIDKDRASALLASNLQVDLFVICTDVEAVYLNYLKPTQEALGRIGADEIERHLQEGQFAPGTMGPKIEAALRFIRHGGREVIITSAERLFDAVHGRAGTHILPAPARHDVRQPALAGGSRS